MSRTPARRVRRAVAFGVALAEELGEHRPGDVEPLDGEVVHLGVELHALAGELLHARADAAGRKKERREHDQRQQRQAPIEPEHDREDHREVDHVRYHGAEGRCDRLLRTDHVVVEPRLQRTGLRAREEGEGHPLHVVEECDAQVVDESLADA
jgi:hypothetical protein